MSNSNSAVNIGDWYSDSCHYTFLAGACFFRVVGKRGKASLVVQRYGSNMEEPDGHTRRISAGSEPIGEPIVVRLNKYGAFRYDVYDHISNDGSTPRVYCGSAYD